MYGIISAMFSNNKTEQYLHQHAYHQILCYSEGKGSMLIEGRKVPVKPDTFIYIPPNAAHRDFNEGELVNYISVMFSTDGEMLSDTPLVFNEENDELRNYVSNIASYFQIDAEKYSEIIELLMKLIIEKLKLRKNMSQDDIAVENYSVIMTKNLANSEYNINSFMNSMDSIRSNISKKFKSAKDCTAKQVFDNIRIEHAKQIIIQDEENNKTTKEIAKICGYDEEYYFSRMFRSRTGMTISEFKKKKTL